MPSDLEIPVASYRVPRPPDKGMKRMALLAGGLGGALLLVVGVWTVSGRHHAHGVPVIEADPRPIRVKPDNPGGMQVAGQNDDLLSGAADETGGKLAPAPETPRPQALRAQQEGEPAKAALAPIPAPPPPPVPTPAVQPVAPPNPAQTGSMLVQLAALETQADARTEWDRLTRKMPELLANRHPSIVRLDRDGKTFWRLRTGAFLDKVQASAFCAQVRAKGGGCNLAL